jgi:hypothetical protein
VEVVGNLGLLPDEQRDLAAYGLGAGTNVSLVWTDTNAGAVEQVVVRGRYAYGG